VRQVDPGALVVHRLKREPSITLKLRNTSGMQLARMQDLGGVRVVVSDMVRLRQVHATCTDATFPYPVVRPYDYIASPKPSGYRSFHLVHRYQNPAVPESDGLLVEVQLRTELQHAWATALETVDAFRQSKLKSSQAEDEWQDFFRLSGAALALLEGLPVNEQFAGQTAQEVFSETAREMDALLVTQKLRSYAKAVRAINGSADGKTCFLLELDIDQSAVNFRSFPSDQLELANQEYLAAEARARETGAYVVLAAAESPEALRDAYPNYFLETGQFLALLNLVRTRAVTG
jgi:putative GTP pyrophosphokinase